MSIVFQFYLFKLSELLKSYIYLEYIFPIKPENKMDTMNDKKLYLQRKADQVQQWERVMENMIARANKAKDKERSEILNQIDNIKVKKENIEHHLRRCKISDEKDWKNEKNDLDKSWKELRDAFSSSAVRS